MYTCGQKNLPISNLEIPTSLKLKTTPVLKVPADSSKWNETSVLTLFDIEVKTRALVNTADTGNQA